MDSLPPFPPAWRAAAVALSVSGALHAALLWGWRAPDSDDASLEAPTYEATLAPAAVAEPAPVAVAAPTPRPRPRRSEPRPGEAVAYLVPTLAQQGTYQPDDSYRWMGSLAVDQDGNMAVGYSVSSPSNPTIYPSIYYAGRLAGEAPGLLPQNEAIMISGSGSQTGINRWGDYSTMTVDPLDDCTFWYTTEYYLTTGTNWQTRIASFQFPSCTP